MAEKIYVGSGKVIQTQYGDFTKISFTAKDIEVLTANLVNGWVNLVLKEKKEPQDGKPTHYLEVDTWQPKKQDVPTEQTANAQQDDIPF